MGKQENATVWSPEEKQFLIYLNSMHPKQWMKISKKMNRTAASIRNCYFRINPNKEKPGRNVCKRCGQFSRGHVCSVSYNEVHMKLQGNAAKLNIHENETEHTSIHMLDHFAIECNWYVKTDIFSVEDMEREWSVFEKQNW